MSFGFSLDIKEQIRQATNIVDLVGSYVRLQPKGRMYVGLCPWHDDSKPSLQIDPVRQTYRCWVCNLGGDVFSFIQQMEGVTFPEALKILAERAKIELPRNQFRPKKFRVSAQGHGFETTDDTGTPTGSSDQAAGTPSRTSRPQAIEFDKRELQEAAAWAEGVFHEFLGRLDADHPVQQYLQKRCITADDIAKFHLGFSPLDRTFLQNQAKNNQRLLQALELTGFIGRGEKGGYYERFSGRLMFPIHDAQGRSVGIGGRVVPGIDVYNADAKYVNTPETPLFSKHQLLYALDLARLAMQKKQRAIVMEGYTDVIAAHQHGFQEAVAVLGTALGPDHIKILKRYVDTIYLVLDGDAAGQKRTAEVLELFVSAHVDVRILTLPENLDPAEFLEAYGAEALDERLKRDSLDALTHAYNIYTRDLDFQNIHQSETALNKLLQLIASGKSSNTSGLLTTESYREEKILQQLAFRFSVSEEFLRRRLREIQAEIRRGETMRERFAQIRGEISEKKPTPPPPQSGEKKLEYRGGSDVTSVTPEWDESEMPVEDDMGFPFEDGTDAAPEGSGSGSPLDTFLSDNALEDPTLLTGEAFEAAADTMDWDRFGKMDAWQREFLTLLFYRPQFLGRARQSLTAERLNYVPAREVFLRMCELDDDGVTPTFDRLLLEFESPKVKSWLVELEAQSVWELDAKSDSELETVLDDMLQNYEQFRIAGRKLQDLGAFRSPKLDEGQKVSMLEQRIREKRQSSRMDLPEKQADATNDARD